MSWRRTLSKVAALFRRPTPVEDLAEEIRAHLEMEQQENVESDMPPKDAHYAALRRFGNVTLAEERSREMWGWLWLENIMQDLRYGVPIYDFTTFESLISESVAQRRFTTVLMLSFAFVATALALIGLFGVMTHLVAQRQREMAIRMALGSTGSALCWLVMRRGAVLTIAGCAIGLLLVPQSTRVVRGMLYQTSAYNVVTLGSVPILLFVAALLATYLPARRATSVDPMVALRHQ